MKFFIALFITFFIITSTTFSQSNSCVDSVRTTIYFHDTDVGGSPVTIYTITTDTFILDSGIVRSCTIGGSDPTNMTLLNCNESYWNKTILDTDSLGRIIVTTILNGSTTGWQNLSRTVYTFDSISGKVASQSAETWIDPVWQQNSLITWTYNSSNNLIEQTTENFSGGTIQNGSRTDWNYNVDTVVSKNTFMLVGTNWINVGMYIFSYDGNAVRDSVLLLKWDNTNLQWDTIGDSPYYMNGLKLADFITIDTIYINGTPLQDSIHFSIDTLENTIFYFEFRPTHQDPMGFFYHMTYLTYAYEAGVLQKVYEHGSDWWDDGLGYGFNWYCTGNDLTSNYDSSGYLISTIQRARCVMPRAFTTTYIYNNDHIIIGETGYLDSNTQYDTYSYNYYYGTADSITAYVSPFYQSSWYLCPGTIVFPSIGVVGGCGSYHYQWTPATGLSSDTIADPRVTVSDTINYTITITDTLGHSALTQFAVNPSLVPATLSLDTTTCIGCLPTISTIYSSNYTYQWYLNGVMIANTDTSSINPNQNGSYFVEITTNSQCRENSDTLNFVSTLNVGNDLNMSAALYPNPAEKDLYIHLNTSNVTSAIIYNSLGQGISVDMDIRNKEILHLNVASLSPGFYYLEISSSDKKAVARFIKN